MATLKHRFDGYLERLRADQIKKMARIWGGTNKLRKAENLALIRQGLDNPAAVRAALARLSDLERAALALLKQLGGECDSNALAVALRASGYVAPARNRYRADNSTVLRKLLDRGLLLSGYTYDPGNLGSSYASPIVFTDDRLLARVTWPLEVKPVRLKPLSPPPAPLERRPSAAALDIIGVLQTIDGLDGLGTTQKGTLRVRDVRKLNQALGWGKESTIVDGLVFPKPAMAFAHALFHSGLSQMRADGVLALTTTPERFARMSYDEQVRGLLYGFTHATEWIEWGEEHRMGYNTNNLSVARMALLMLLMALPEAGESFFSTEALDAAFFERVGEYFSLRSYSSPQPPYWYGKPPAEQERMMQEWRQKLRAQWLIHETPWLKAALMTWLYYLGIVALGMDNGTPVSFRLTDLGRSVLQGKRMSTGRAEGEAQTAWIVQPNLEILVYLEHVTPEQLVFLEQHAARVGAQQHTAQYQLNQETVYAALERGSTLEGMLATLLTGSSAPLPQNVTVELREWAARRERMTLYQRARLLEFPDAAHRDAALEAGLRGAPVGERFVLLASAAPDPTAHPRGVNYARPLSRCLTVTEDGMVTLLRPDVDLIIEGELDLWAERRDATTWQLTADSVRAALRTGACIEEALNWLAARLTGGVPVPPLLRAALLAWTGIKVETHLAEVVVLQCKQREVFDAIVGSPALKPLLRGVLAPDLVLVDPAAVETLRAHLVWAGFEVAEALKVKRR
ncbi:MAG: helicase-associated domain-containing protein [Anaerolineae bacterium]